LLRRLLRDFQGDVLAIPGRLLALIFFVVLFFIPLFLQGSSGSYYLRIFIFANMYVIFAVSWDLLSGYTGQLNFGHALFFGVAAYTTALLNIHLGWQPWATIPIGALAGVIAGLIVCLPALRLRGPYLALVTLAFPLILLGIIFAFTDFTGGELGISGLDRISDSRTTDYYISVAVMIVSVMIMWKLTDAGSSIIRTGIVFHAKVIIWTVFGGITSIYGPVVGVYILFPLMEFLRAAPEVRYLIFAGIVVIMLLFMPEGIAVWVRDKIERECPRCKLSNMAFRKTCRACNTYLYEHAGD